MREKPRERTMPLVPQPFDRAIISRQTPFFGVYRSTPMAEVCGRFCPDLNFRPYLSGQSEEKRTEHCQRFSKLMKRANVNHFYNASEFSWEVSAWSDVFGLILEDEGLRMDKRPYEFTEKDDKGQFEVKNRIPDATMGLKSYNNHLLERGYICEDPDCNDDHTTKQPDERLSEDLLCAMMQNPECGLIVDGVWGKADLIFPFAIYEAKKQATSYADAEQQIYHACRTYLAMLDDLARNPDNLSEYQSEESDKYQLFAFTSCGSYWQVFVAWNLMNDCMVDTIWEGDVRYSNYAIELICIIDQIHDYATQQHRPFVMKHLEAWHDRHKRTANTAAANDNSFMASPLSVPSPSEDPYSSNDEHLHSGSSLGVDEMANLFDLSPHMPQPEWSRLKVESKITRSFKAYKTRAYNQELRGFGGLSARAPEVEKTPGKKQPRGRPPKAATHKQKPLQRQQAQSSKAIGGGAVSKTKPRSSRVTRSMAKGL